MASPEQYVQEFRDVVEQVIEQQASKTSIRFGGMEGVRVAGLLFEKRDSTGGGSLRFRSVAKNETVWGVESPQLKYAKHSGRLAVVSLESLPNNLLRTWHFNGPRDWAFSGAFTQRELTQEELSLAVQWIRSPHLSVAALDQMSTMTAEEMTHVDEELAEEWKNEQALQKDLDALARNRRRGIPSDIVLD